MSTEIRTNDIVDALQGIQSYINIKKQAALLLARGDQTLHGLSMSLRENPQLTNAWEDTQQTLMKSTDLWNAANWNGMVSLSAPFWEARPSDYEGGLCDACQMLSDHVRQIQATSGVHCGLCPLAKTKVVLVYVKHDVPVAPHVHELQHVTCTLNSGNRANMYN